jgi:hypothetical protein
MANRGSEPDRDWCLGVSGPKDLAQLALLWWGLRRQLRLCLHELRTRNHSLCSYRPTYATRINEPRITRITRIRKEFHGIWFSLRVIREICGFFFFSSFFS